MRKKTNDFYNCRGKSTETGEWLFGSVFFVGNRGYILTVPSNQRAKKVIENLGDYATEVDTKTVAWCIGINYTNGMPVFEGDIIRETVEYDRELATGDVLECYYVIKWVEKYNSYLAIPFEDGKLFKNLHLFLDSLYAIRQNSFYVVGNVHDNDLNEYKCKCKE